MTPCLRRLLRLLVHAWALRFATPVIAAGWRQAAEEWQHAADLWRTRAEEAMAGWDAADEDAEMWMTRFTLLYQLADHEHVDPWLDTLDDVLDLKMVEQ